MTDPIIRFDGVDFGYGSSPILQDLSFSVQQGELLAIMGGSGSGKTTILRLIGALVRQQRGSIRVRSQALEGLDADGLRALRRHMGMLFQGGALFTDLTVFENVAFPLREHTRLPERMIRDLVLMKLHAVGLHAVAERMPSELSGGMARRVALARAIALDPPILMCDEPFAGLDPISLGTVARLLSQLSKALGLSTLLVTHDVEESLAIADRIMLLGQGRIMALGTPASMRQSEDPFVRQFIDGSEKGPVPFHAPGPGLGALLGLDRG
ncbi:MAG: ABC transporter ATP-binding protein [Betaproteobacteria bacterium]|nr:ABC transporter ATP-binding protein [Betaproteobacteria bacterium]NCW00275.1 ABC transporter ATP-binding protein [Betaproteobacteria bacterium]NCX23735.1 ABC transporter ATP-binding protein [Betaproteobacteria bacterium]NCZ30005.1 ABC transporter ATP-binding protein [Betaproteobacteria bacterium]NCZ81831.1 ABC transporter ATP-binding protein [Betaproteobacteria bacterium]